MSKRRKREVETPDYAAMLRRMIRAYGRRVADSDPADLAELLTVQAELEAAIVAAVAGQRRRFSWSEIAVGLGVTKQTAHGRFAHVVDNDGRSPLTVVDDDAS